MSRRMRWAIFLGMMVGVVLSSIGENLMEGETINWTFLIPNYALVAAGLYYLLIIRRVKQPQEQSNLIEEKKGKKKRKNQ
ncbi:MAG: hypothetical protein VR72_16085 [Clostridiaceae bacterium BRH_c20a]|nr:MAG: hypothetical protein VR72_16085 [Clostridiaceae bacterium BRH_c20a]